MDEISLSVKRAKCFPIRQEQELEYATMKHAIVRFKCLASYHFQRVSNKAFHHLILDSEVKLFL